jgi:nitrile hydratase
VLGYPPFWFKSAGYRARAVRDPRGALAEWGTVLSPDTRIVTVDSTADYRWMVLPMRPAGTENFSEDELAALVDECDMIGVTVPSGQRKRQAGPAFPPGKLPPEAADGG